jgi:hypothetical protein
MQFRILRRYKALDTVLPVLPKCQAFCEAITKVTYKIKALVKRYRSQRSNKKC